MDTPKDCQDNIFKTRDMAGSMFGVDWSSYGPLHHQVNLPAKIHDWNMYTYGAFLNSDEIQSVGLNMAFALAGQTGLLADVNLGPEGCAL